MDVILLIISCVFRFGDYQRIPLRFLEVADRVFRGEFLQTGLSVARLIS